MDIGLRRGSQRQLVTRAIAAATVLYVDNNGELRGSEQKLFRSTGAAAFRELPAIFVVRDKIQICMGRWRSCTLNRETQTGLRSAARELQNSISVTCIEAIVRSVASAAWSRLRKPVDDACLNANK